MNIIDHTELCVSLRLKQQKMTEFKQGRLINQTFTPTALCQALCTQHPGYITPNQKKQKHIFVPVVPAHHFVKHSKTKKD